MQCRMSVTQIHMQLIISINVADNRYFSHNGGSNDVWMFVGFFFLGGERKQHLWEIPVGVKGKKT